MAGLALPASALPPSEAPGPLAPELGERIANMAREGARQMSSAPVRVEVEVGQLDPRLRLAPCAKIEPYLPPQAPVWGRTRIGLRCLEGAKLWNVSLPVTVRVYSMALVANAALPAGTQLEAHHLGLAEVDLAARPGLALRQTGQAVGRQLLHGLAAGDTVRVTDLRARRWFAAGETVRVTASGPGWRVVTEGQALSAGIEGEPVKVRVDNGRMLQGRAVADRQVEVLL